jgi:hypothetical protein
MPGMKPTRPISAYTNLSRRQERTSALAVLLFTTIPSFVDARMNTAHSVCRRLCFSRDESMHDNTVVRIPAPVLYVPAR